MKPVTKKLIEAGLVTRDIIALLNRWGFIEPDFNGGITSRGELVDTKKFITDLEEILDRSFDLRETKLELTASKIFIKMLSGKTYKALEDTSKYIYVSSDVEVNLGSKFEVVDGYQAWEDTPGQLLVVEDITELFMGDQTYMKQLTVSPVKAEKDASREL